MPTAYINIGSNMGNRQAQIEQAVAHIEHLCGSTARRAPMFYSQPCGYESNAEFLNLGIAIEISINPITLLHSLQEIERKISATPHRDEQGNYIDRNIDIDIIAIDETVINTSELVLPHPRMHQRDFVLIPMQHLAPTWRHPLLNSTVTELSSRLNQGK